MRIDVYSHSIRVTEVLTERDLDAMYSFCKPLIEYGLQKKRGRFTRVGLRTFAAATRNRREFGFHRNQLEDLKKHLFMVKGYPEHLIPITIHDPRDIKTDKVVYKVKSMHTPRPIQLDIIKYVLDSEDPSRDAIIKMVTLQPGGGKLISDDEMIRMPGGWKRNGDIRPGDIITARDGSPTTVLQIHPEKDVQLYTLVLQDGRKLDVCLEHQWGVYVDDRYSVLNTGQILEHLERSERVYLPTVCPDNGDVRAAGSNPNWLESSAVERYEYVRREMELYRNSGEVDIERLRFLQRMFWSLGAVATIDDSGELEVDVHSKQVRVVDVVKSKVGDATCLTIDHPDALYVAGDYIVTHNTFISQYCFNQMGCRAVIHFKGGYTERWVSDLNDTFEFDEGELLVVRGSKDMVKLMKMALEDKLIAQVIIISTATMRDYIKDYEDSNGKSKKYPIKPIDFYPTLKVGIRINDEFHQEFHNNFRMDLYTHVPKSLALSATMVSSDKFKNKMYEIACPTEHRHDGGEYKVYIGVTEVLYDIDPEIHVRYMGDMGYSHTTYEGSILRHKGILKNYFKIVESTIYERFVSVREPGQKALVFFATVNMCTLFVKHLERLYPDLDVARYVGSEGDEYEDMVNADITVSTVGSAGTAIDIPNLRCSFMTTALDSRQSNEQALGRTRPPKDWKDITPEFIYFSCTDIDQHTKYSDNKKAFFKGKVLYHNSIRSKYRLTKENNSRW